MTQKGVGTLVFLQHPRQRPGGAVQLVPEPGLLLGRGFWKEVLSGSLQLDGFLKP